MVQVWFNSDLPDGEGKEIRKKTLGLCETRLLALTGYLSRHLLLSLRRSRLSRMNPPVAGALTEEPVQVQRTVLGIMSIVKNIVKRLAGLLRQEGIKFPEQNKTSAESIAVIVHELRTLLTPLRASGELLFQELGREPDSPEAKLAQNIVAGANSLEYWLSEMQELVKSEAGTP